MLQFEFRALLLVFLSAPVNFRVKIFCLISEPDEVPIFVDELHPEVIAMVDEIMANTTFEDADLPVTEIAIDTLTEAVAAAEEEKLLRQPSAPRFVH